MDKPHKQTSKTGFRKNNVRRSNSSDSDDEETFQDKVYKWKKSTRDNWTWQDRPSYRNLAIEAVDINNNLLTNITSDLKKIQLFESELDIVDQYWSTRDASRSTNELTEDKSHSKDNIDVEDCLRIKREIRQRSLNRIDSLRQASLSSSMTDVNTTKESNDKCFVSNNNDEGKSSNHTDDNSEAVSLESSGKIFKKANGFETMRKFNSVRLRQNIYQDELNHHGDETNEQITVHSHTLPNTDCIIVPSSNDQSYKGNVAPSEEISNPVHGTVLDRALHSRSTIPINDLSPPKLNNQLQYRIRKPKSADTPSDNYYRRQYEWLNQKKERLKDQRLHQQKNEEKSFRDKPDITFSQQSWKIAKEQRSKIDESAPRVDELVVKATSLRIPRSHRRIKDESSIKSERDVVNIERRITSTDDVIMDDRRDSQPTASDSLPTSPEANRWDEFYRNNEYDAVIVNDDDDEASFFDKSSTAERGRHLISDGTLYDADTIHRRHDSTEDGVVYVIGKKRDSFTDSLIMILFDRSKFTEQSARLWWMSRNSSILVPSRPETPPTRD